MGTTLKFLVDSGLLLPPDPAAPDREADRAVALAEAARLAAEYHHRLYIHPAARQEMLAEKLPGRSELHRSLLRPYSVLSLPPDVPAQFDSVFGTPPSGTREWMNIRLVAALAADAVDFLISADRDLRRKAKRLGLEERVVLTAEAASMIRDLEGTGAQDPPIMEEAGVSALNPEDPIFDPVRGNGLDFKSCFVEAENADWRAWISRDGGHMLAACCIAAEDRIPPPSLTGKVLQIRFFWNIRLSKPDVSE